MSIQMSTPTVTTKTTIMPKMPLVLKRTRIFLSSFIVGLVFNIALIILVYTFGVSTGYEGEPSFSWDQLGNSMGFLFGGLPSLLGFIGGLAIFAVTLKLVDWLSKNGHHKWLLFAFIVGFVLGGIVLWPLISALGSVFGVLPFVGLIAFTALEAFITLLSTLPSRKSDTTH